MSNEPEHKMLFDLRGRRKRVIQVIYVILAVLMAGSLLVIGMPGGLNPFSSGSSVVSQDGADLAIKRAESLDSKLQTKPKDEHAQIELIRARIAAGRSLIEVDDSGQQTIGEKASAQYDLAAEAWEKYLKTTGNQPDPSVAQLMADTLFTLSQGASVAQFQSNIQAAAKAQGFFTANAVKEAKKGGQSPASSLTQLAMYQFYAQDFAAGDANRDKAMGAAKSEAEKKQIKTQLDSYRKDAKRIGKVLAQAKKQAKKDGGKALEDPLGGLGSGSSLGGTTSP